MLRNSHLVEESKSCFDITSSTQSSNKDGEIVRHRHHSVFLQHHVLHHIYSFIQLNKYT